MMEEFYIQDTRHYVGNSVLWWRPNGNGYTTNLDEAWRVPKDKAESIERKRGTDKAWRCDLIDPKTTRQFDMQLFQALPPERSE